VDLDVGSVDGLLVAGQRRPIYGQALNGVRPPARFVPHVTAGRCAEKAALRAGISEADAINLPMTGRALSLILYRRDGNGGRVREANLATLTRRHRSRRCAAVPGVPVP
jgi:hypothetical protein